MFFDVSLRHQIGDCRLALTFRSEARLTALVGPSGSGKTSVLNAIAGLLRPESGHIAVNGRVLFDTASAVDLAPERRHAGYVFQDLRLFPHRKVDANLTYGERLSASAERWIGRQDVIRTLDIENLLDRWPASLSGGEMRRVAIARALLSAPRFLLLDEPFAALDSKRADALRGQIEQIRDEFAIPILLVSHDTRDVERLAGDVVHMS